MDPLSAGSHDLPLCATCARWVAYPCIIRTTPTEAWRCLNAVVTAPRATECSCYLRATGSEPW